MRARAMRALHRFRPMIDGLPQGKYLVLAERTRLPAGLQKGFNIYSTVSTDCAKCLFFVCARAIVALEITYNREMMEPDFCGERLPGIPSEHRC